MVFSSLPFTRLSLSLSFSTSRDFILTAEIHGKDQKNQETRYGDAYHLKNKLKYDFFFIHVPGAETCKRKKGSGEMKYPK